MLETMFRRVGLSWEAVASQEVSLYHEQSGYSAWGGVGKLHTTTGCSAIGDRPSYHHSWSRQRNRCISESQKLSMLDRLSERWCARCADTTDILDRATVPGRTDVSLNAAVNMASTLAEDLTWFGENTISLATAPEWQRRIASVQYSGVTLRNIRPGTDAVLDQAAALLATLEAMRATDQTLYTWAKRHALAKTFTGAPVPPSVLVAPLGGIGAVEDEFRRYRCTDPLVFAPREGFEALYDRWDAAAEEVDLGPLTLVVVVAPGFDAQFGQAVLRDAEHALAARFTGSPVHFVPLPLAAARVLREVGTAARWDVSYVLAPDGLPEQAVTVAQALVDDGFTPAEAAQVVVSV